jgi:para-nitrobenzyl esterase
MTAIAGASTGKRRWNSRLWCHLGVCVGLLVLATVAQASAEGRDGNTVATDKGVVTGLEKGGVRRFLGIPYALAPVGRMRWMPPEPAVAWTSILQAAHYAKRCPQNETLGVFAEPSRERRLPVPECFLPG